ncbi:hypothetical protein [Candidatus Vidania fulgoroideorum]
MSRTVNVIFNNKIYTLEYFKAFEIAKKNFMDLIKIDDGKNLYKMIKYSKIMYYKSKVKNVRKSVTKEIKFSIKISRGDFNTKLKKINNILKKKNNVKVSVFLKGRQISKKQIVFKMFSKILNYFKNNNDNISHSEIKLNGRVYFFYLKNENK